MLEQETTTANVSFSFDDYSEPVFDSTIQFYEVILILIAFIIFVVGILGNILVVFVVMSNSHMRTITNMFIVNLAIGDLMVTIICLPPSILTDVTGNWYFGETMCKIIVYIQVS
jgi:hypocretin (orexin) receptor 2